MNVHLFTHHDVLRRPSVMSSHFKREIKSSSDIDEYIVLHFISTHNLRTQIIYLSCIINSHYQNLDY